MAELLPPPEQPAAEDCGGGCVRPAGHDGPCHAPIQPHEGSLPTAERPAASELLKGSVELLERAAKDAEQMSEWPDRKHTHGLSLKAKAAEYRHAADILRTYPSMEGADNEGDYSATRAASEGEERLSTEDERLLRDNLWDLYETDAPSVAESERLPTTNAVARLLWRHILDDMAHPQLLSSYDPSDPRRYESLSESDKALLRRRADEILALIKSPPQEKGR